MTKASDLPDYSGIFSFNWEILKIEVKAKKPDYDEDDRKRGLRSTLTQLRWRHRIVADEYFPRDT
jgi:hypothetical protein